MAVYFRYVDPNARSADIDAAVRLVAEDGGPVYHVNDLVAQLEPTVIIAQNQVSSGPGAAGAATPVDARSFHLAQPS